MNYIHEDKERRKEMLSSLKKPVKLSGVSAYMDELRSDREEAKRLSTRLFTFFVALFVADLFIAGFIFNYQYSNVEGAIIIAVYLTSLYGLYRFRRTAKNKTIELNTVTKSLELINNDIDVNQKLNKVSSLSAKRKSAGLTQVQLAKKAKVSVSTIRAIESGSRTTKSTLAKIEKVFACKL